MYIDKTNFIVCDRCEHQKITFFFHTGIFQNCIPLSLYVCVIHMIHHSCLYDSAKSACFGKIFLK